MSPALISPRLSDAEAAARGDLLDHSAQYQRGVDSAEAEGVGEDVLDTLLPPGARQKIKIAGLVRNLKVDRRRQPLTLYCQSADCGFNRARCAQCVTVVSLGAAHRNAIRAIAEHLLDRHGLRRVVERSRAAVRVDVVDLVG